MHWCNVILIVWIKFCLSIQANELCNITPPLTDVPKTPGDNDFKIIINGNPNTYSPGATYTG